MIFIKRIKPHLVQHKIFEVYKDQFPVFETINWCQASNWQLTSKIKHKYLYFQNHFWNLSFSLLVVSDKNIGDDERILGHLLKLEIRKPIFDEPQTFHLHYQLLNKFKKLMENFIFVVWFFCLKHIISVIIYKILFVLT